MLREAAAGPRPAGLRPWSVLVFVLAAYISFSLFVRSGVTAVPEPARHGARRGRAHRWPTRGCACAACEESGRYDERGAGRARAAAEPRTRAPWSSAAAASTSCSRWGRSASRCRTLAGRGVPAAQVTLSARRPRRRPHPRRLQRAPRPPAPSSPSTRRRRRRSRPQTPRRPLLALPSPGERYLMPDLVYRHYEERRARSSSARASASAASSTSATRGWRPASSCASSRCPATR